MSIRSSSLASEVPGTTLAVQHLQELACRMKNYTFNSTQTDLQNIDTVIEAIRELVEDCSKLHDKLETETIQASVLRYKLKHYPKEIRDEVKRAIDAAQHSNGDELGQLRAEWQSIEDRILSMEQSLKQLDADNAFLAPERDRSRTLHEDIVNQLNQRMSDKADSQIRLNETRDLVRETNQRIVAMEEGMLQLKDDMIEERAIARQEKLRLKKELSETTLTLGEQQKNNEEKKIEMDTAFETMSLHAKKLTQLQESTTELDASCNQLEAKEELLQKKLDSSLSTRSRIKTNISTLNNSLNQEKKAFAVNKSQLESRIVNLDEQIDIELKSTADLKAERDLLKNAIQGKMKQKEADEERVKDINKTVQEQKTELAKNAEKLAQLHQDITEVEQKMADLVQSHSAVLDSLNRTAEECRKQLSKQRLERMELDAELEEIERGLEFLQSEAKRFQEQCRSAMVSGKRDHDQLTQDGFRLQNLIKESQNTIKQLQEELIHANADRQIVEKNIAGEVENVQSEIESMSLEIQDKLNAINMQQPDYEVLQKVFQERTAVFDKAKKDLASMKNKKASTEDEIRSTIIAIQQTAALQAELRESLTDARSESMERLKENMNQLQLLEQEIYAVDCKLDRLLDENTRFTESIGQLESNVHNIAEQKRYNETMCQKLTEELDSIRYQLAESWIREDIIQQTVDARDVITVADLGSLHQDTDGRQQVVDRVTTHLELELVLLADFLDKVARRRPFSASGSKSKNSLELTSAADIRPTAEH